jgi:hypothetical protein
MLYPLSYGGDNADATNVQAGPRYSQQVSWQALGAQSRARPEGLSKRSR